MAQSLRSLLESTTSKIPDGPLGFIGGGNAVGASVFFLVGAVNGINPVNGFDVGYNVESHSVERQNGIETHTFMINAALGDVARFVAKKRSAPSNIDFALRDTKVKSVEPAVERATFNTWEVVVVVRDREELDDE